MLHPNEVYYNITIQQDLFNKWGQFYIGNGDVFIMGQTYSLHGENDKIILELTFINSWYKYNINFIMSDSYEKVGKHYYDTIEDAINMDEMIKYWIMYKDFKCNKLFISSTSFKINGNILNKIKYRTMSLVDQIIYNKLIKLEDMETLPNSYNLCEKINKVYNKNIFNLDELYSFDNLAYEC
jgi:hypothetical protein